MYILIHGVIHVSFPDATSYDKNFFLMLNSILSRISPVVSEKMFAKHQRHWLSCAEKKCHAAFSASRIHAKNMPTSLQRGGNKILLFFKCKIPPTKQSNAQHLVEC